MLKKGSFNMLRAASKILSYLGLGLTLLPSFLVFSGKIGWNLHVHLMLAGMILWFVFAVLGSRLRRS
jgi:hypothetical protein